MSNKVAKMPKSKTPMCSLCLKAPTNNKVLDIPYGYSLCSGCFIKRSELLFPELQVDDCERCAMCYENAYDPTLGDPEFRMCRNCHLSLYVSKSKKNDKQSKTECLDLSCGPPTEPYDINEMRRFYISDDDFQADIKNLTEIYDLIEAEYHLGVHRLEYICKKYKNSLGGPFSVDNYYTLCAALGQISTAKKVKIQKNGLSLYVSKEQIRDFI